MAYAKLPVPCHMVGAYIIMNTVLFFAIIALLTCLVKKGKIDLLPKKSK